MPDQPDTPTTTGNPAPLSPWERLPTESPEAWEAFITARDMGIQRSNAKVGRVLGKSVTLMDRWSRTHAWVARCESWDDELDRERRAEHVEAIRSMSARHVALAHSLIEKVTERLKTLDVNTLTPTQLARFARDAVTIERLALGQPTPKDTDTSDADEASFVALEEATRRWFEERETAAFMEGAAAGAAVADENAVVTEDA